MSVSALHVLLIEDREADADLVRQALDCPNLPAQVDLQVAPSLEAAEQLLEARPIDLILLNSELDVAGHSALDWLPQFKTQHPLRRIPVIVLTRLDDDQHVQAAYQQHASAYLIKRQGVQDIREMLRALLLFWGQVARLPPPAR